ncbi:E3 ubiquitin-protein ligase [Komagataella phaffii CBS 7435]|uniref:E3 ubiquitin-protein ligase PEP5 n=2 Tax=Komagataella phaffii TaxID=460519 RepID=C4QVM0_KOMPG|nr:uncharacterized protein PAS_chr1-3_0306 [Komagataella phaffii GS115]AOA61392.1 GQ67_02492T0 [Komagataella phaffii]CAH2445950.1 E3 ubiquitin-protein ligase [Komagataella phaffii CBS 7435]AOA65918.1 GQ68_02755T0 [Komagataella phaffii GS115]CAY67293.1 hypothetical protein PAS_chr1-3_0306 [Komagataella phaffii GS115]CCA36398.1 E3 ubiquitin-protein ligase [Komagataella phaffii CBS 7435]
MSLSSWRQFSFFELTPIKDPNLGSEKSLYSDPSLTSVCASPEYLIIATAFNKVQLITKDYIKKFDFTAYELGWNIVHLVYLTDSHFLCTIAERQGFPLTLKLWNLKKLMAMEKSDESLEFEFHSSCQIANGNNNFPMTAFTHCNNFSILCFGFSNGSVILVRGDLLHDKGTRQRLVFESNEPVTNLLFKDENSLYLTTTSKIYTIPTTGKNQGKPDKIIDRGVGVDIGCCTLDHKRHLVVGNDSMLQCYSTRGKSNAIALDISKKKLFAFGKYILIISNDHKLLIIDVINMFIALNENIETAISNIFLLWDDVYMLGSDGVLYRIHELDQKAQLDIVVSRNLYDIAIRLAQSMTGIEESDILTVHRKYGDYLYEQQSYGEAMTEYIKCLALGKTSEIIAKYKDSSKISRLALYLEAMVEEGQARKDHITLLLCSYCKLKQIDKLLEFPQKHPDVEFDLFTLIDLCRESDYLEVASTIAKQFNEPSIVVDIELNDLNKTKSTLAYLRTLQIEDLLRVLLDHLKPFLTRLPHPTTKLLIEVFTGKFKPTPVSQEEKISEPEEKQFPVLQSYQAFVSYMASLTETSTSENEQKDDISPTYLPPRPSIIFSSFIDHPNEFIIFLEACLESHDYYGGNDQDRSDILTTLYEVYLTMAQEEPDQKSEWEEKALTLIKNNKAKMNETSIILISNLYGFNAGEMLVRDQQVGFEIDLFRSAMSNGDLQSIQSILQEYAEEQPELYRLGLSYYISDPDIFKKVEESGAFKQLLDTITTRNLMTPLQIVQKLGENSIATVGIVKEYLLRYVTAMRTEILNNEKLIDHYSKQIERDNAQVEDLKHNPVTLQNTRCHSCSLPLDLPIIYFLCHHSYHERCLNDSEYENSKHLRSELECPKCAEKTDTITALRKEQEEVSQRNDLFAVALENSSDRFKTITGFFAKGSIFDGVNYLN